jgi:alpha-L-fucosidase
MKKFTKAYILIYIFLFSFTFFAYSQSINQSNPKYNIQNTKIRSSIFNNEYNYQRPVDTLVAERLAEWQKRKFGLMMHWGPYTQWNIIESWTIVSSPELQWNPRTGPYAEDYDAYKTAYENLQHTFNPYLFNPDELAIAAKNAGMKYLVFTVKHLDGFCMYSSRLTNYNISDTSCPFHSDPRNNIANVLFNSFRSRDFFIGMYYSKADLYCRDFFWKAFATPWIDVNYSPLFHPEKWSRYVQYVHNQINELMTTLGKIDILWLDACWINPTNKNQNIQMDQIASIARTHQPGLIMVNRYCGEYEDYLTPEEVMPEIPNDYPWELCMPIGHVWAHIVEDSLFYKSTDSIIHTLAEVAGKGGNLLLNISPNRYGQWHYKAFTRLTEIGNWMNINSSAIYETQHTMPFRENNIFYTKKGDTTFALYLKNDNQTTMPPQISWASHLPQPKSNIYLLGYPYPLNYNVTSNMVTVFIPSRLQNNPPCRHAWVFKIIKDNPVIINNENNSKIPNKYILHQNFPNPFNPKTVIKFELPSFHDKLKNTVQLKVFDILGREIRTLINKNLAPGTYNVTFNGKELSSGIYFFQLKAGDFTNIKKMTLLK